MANDFLFYYYIPVNDLIYDDCLDQIYITDTAVMITIYGNYDMQWCN